MNTPCELLQLSVAMFQLKTTTLIAAELASRWFRDAKARLDELFAKSGNRILIPYAPSMAIRHQVFEKLRRNQINILLIGRTRIGKTTLKDVLANPTAIPSDEKTEFPQFEQFAVTGTDTILNFIDTPGLFQRTQTASGLPDNMTLIQLIESYIRSKVNQLHFVCFCISIETPVLAEDLEVLRAFFNVLGPDIRRNTCVIITQCESKTERERDDFHEQAQRNLDLKVLCSQMKQGIFFTGSINSEDWMKTSNVIYKQFQTVCDYRQKLLDLFINSDINPIDLSSNILAKKLKDDLQSKTKKRSSHDK